MEIKMIKRIILPMLVGFLFTSCLQRGEPGDLTLKGKNVCDSWNNAYQYILHEYIEPVYNFNAWYEAPDDKKDSVEFVLFPQYRIRTLGQNQWEIYANGKVVYRILGDGQALSSPGSRWIIRIEDQFLDQNRANYNWGNYLFTSFKGQTVRIEVSTIQAGEWTFSAYNQDESVPRLTIGVKDLQGEIPYTIKKSQIAFTGTGTLEYEDHSQKESFIKFTINEGLLYAPATYPYTYDYSMNFGKGIVSLDAQNEKGNKETRCKAEFFYHSYHNHGVNITYNNVTEQW